MLKVLLWSPSVQPSSAHSFRLSVRVSPVRRKIERLTIKKIGSVSAYFKNKIEGIWSRQAFESNHTSTFYIVPLCSRRSSFSHSRWSLFVPRWRTGTARIGRLAPFRLHSRSFTLNRLSRDFVSQCRLIEENEKLIRLWIDLLIPQCWTQFRMAFVQEWPFVQIHFVNLIC